MKLNREKYSRSKVVLHYCWIILLTLSFCLQQFSTFANTRKVDSRARENYGRIQSGHVLINAQVAPLLPCNETSAEPEAELAEEEENRGCINKYWNQFAEKHLSGEIFYSTFLRNRFLQLTTSIHNRSSIPIFILYRSWKSFLS